MPETSAERRTRSWRRDNRLREYGFEDYAAYINSPQWRAKRELFWGIVSRTCSICRTADGPMVLHHRTYERVCREVEGDLVPLCPPCHELAHLLEARGDLSLDADFEALFRPERAVEFVAVGASPERLRLLSSAKPRLKTQYERLSRPGGAPRTRRTIVRNALALERKIAAFA